MGLQASAGLVLISIPAARRARGPLRLGAWYLSDDCGRAPACLVQNRGAFGLRGGKLREAMQQISEVPRPRPYGLASKPPPLIETLNP
jgi:hypothetical protein